MIRTRRTGPVPRRIGGGGARMSDAVPSAFSPPAYVRPAFLSPVPGYGFAVRWVEAAGSRGGDWTEAVSLGDGRLAVAIGDLVGGDEFATVIALLRGALVSSLLAGDDLLAVLGRLDTLAARLPGAVGSTLAVVMLDPARGLLSFVSAGHPPPLLVTEAGDATFLAGSRGVPLAAAGAPVIAQAALAEGDTLVLYTDGVVAGRGWSAAEADSAFSTAASAVQAELLTCGEVAERLLGVMLPEGEAVQDEAVLVVVRPGSLETAPFRLEVPAHPAQLAVVRRALGAWLASGGVGPDDAMSVQLAVGEALANSIEHAYPEGAQGRAVVAAAITAAGHLDLEVADTGAWREADLVASAHRGRGLQLMRATMSMVRLVRGASGTTVSMHFQLAAEPGAVAEPAEQPGTDIVEIEVLTDAKPVCVRLSGEFDAANAESVREQVQRISRGGSIPLRLDLAGLTYLDSFALRSLFELAMAAEASGERLAVTARRGSMIERVLTASGFDQLATLDSL
jgi:anti-anti-sigma factor